MTAPVPGHEALGAALAFDALTCPLAETQLIEASAGTGKTWNLCRLYLRLILERRLDVRQVLVVTFTNAATAELRERVRARLVETADALRGHGAASPDRFVADLLESLRRTHGVADADMLHRLDDALQSFDEAAIFTIHGFCQRALGELPFAAGAPLALEQIADDAELRLEAVNDVWRRHFAGSALPAYVARHLLECSDTPARHAELLQKVLAKPLSRLLWPPELERELEPQAGASDGGSVAIEALHRQARRLWQDDRDSIVGAVAAARSFSLNKRTYPEGRIERAAADWDAYLASPRTTAIPAPGFLRYLGSEALTPNKGKPAVREHAFYAVAQALVEAHETQRRAAALQRLRLLRTLLDEAATALRATKQARRVVAFDDMLWNLYERLQAPAGTPFAAALRQRYPAALIDEFQDTDPLQFAIFRAVYGGSASPLFLVGDPKQAIYSFRNADLHTYLRAQQEAAAVYTLTDNQRSSRGLLAALNALFGANAQAFMLPGLVYRSVAYGAKPRSILEDDSAARAPLQLWSLPGDEEGNPLPKERAESLATAACAGEIARLLAASQDGRVRLDRRPLVGGDIAVLVRTNAQGAAMREALAGFGVASVQLSELSLFASAEAAEIELVLAAVLEPTKQRRLRAALSSETLGYDAAAIDALDGDEAGLLAVVGRFIAYRQRWRQRGCGAMLRQLFAAEEVSARMLARRDGERRMTNLRHLAEVLQQATERHPAPQALLRWLRAQRGVLRVDEANQLRLESDRNLVQIVTIHKAKGLEYGFVFCPYLWQGNAARGEHKDLREYHDAEHQPVLDFRSSMEDKQSRREVATQLAFERACEDLRLIYVALTRAVHRCYLVTGSYVTRQQGRDGGEATRPSTSESHRAVLNWLVAGQGQAAAQWLEGRPSVDEIRDAWHNLAAAAAPAIGLE
ncbi:MAG: UvrD-helicase domain-containing protein, partial [Pseudomonadota bacterium]|nr:UvrD-helicase domain-containing protein [Pseudomonadota bacterium]